MITEPSPGQKDTPCEHKDGYSKYPKNGIFIHRTNNNGTANGRVSLGCLLIKAPQMINFEKHVGRNSFKVILRRK